MKKFLLFLAVLLGGISPALAQEVLSTAGFWGNSSSYQAKDSKTSENTFLGSKWSAAGFSNNGGKWTDYRCGRSGSAEVAYITNTSAI